MNDLKQLTAEERKLIERLRKDEDMRKAVGARVGKNENTVRQWSCYRPWNLTQNPAALEEAKRYAKEHPFQKAA